MDVMLLCFRVAAFSMDGSTRKQEADRRAPDTLAGMAGTGLALSIILTGRAIQRCQINLFLSKQAPDCQPSRLVFLGTQLAAVVPDIEPSDVHTLVHGASRLTGQSSLLRMAAPAGMGTEGWYPGGRIIRIATGEVAFRNSEDASLQLSSKRNAIAPAVQNCSERRLVVREISASNRRQFHMFLILP